MPNPATLAVMITLLGSSIVARFCSSGANSLTVLNTALTFRSMTLAKASSGCESKGAPQLAPALAMRMSTWSVCALTSSSSFLTPASLAESEGTEMARPEMPGSALSVAQAESQADALREVMNTLEQPACSSAEAADRPRPREPPVTTATFPLREKRVGNDSRLAASVMVSVVVLTDG